MLLAGDNVVLGVEGLVEARVQHPVYAPQIGLHIPVGHTRVFMSCVRRGTRSEWAHSSSFGCVCAEAWLIVSIIASGCCHGSAESCGFGEEEIYRKELQKFKLNQTQNKLPFCWLVENLDGLFVVVFFSQHPQFVDLLGRPGSFFKFFT